jgi:hypothetical protein
LLGERFFASGDERTAVRFPAGYGYRVRWYDSLNMLVDLMNMGTTPQTAYVQVNFTVRPSWECVRSVRPVWLDTSTTARMRPTTSWASCSATSTARDRHIAASGVVRGLGWSPLASARSVLER